MKIIVLSFFISFNGILLNAQKCNVANYPFNGNANDVSGNNFNGYVFGATSTYDRFSKANSAFSFDGIDDYIAIPSDNLFNFDVGDDFSISMWVFASATQNYISGYKNSLIEKKEDYNSASLNEGHPFVIRIDNQTSASKGRISAYRFDKVCSNTSSIETDSLVGDAGWRHIVMIKDKAVMKLYINNVLDTTSIDITSCTTQNNDSLFIGRKGGTFKLGYFTGIIDDILICNCPLDSSDIDSIYHAIPVGISSVSAEKRFELFPNPSSGEVNLILNKEYRSIQIRVTTIQGNAVYQENFQNVNQIHFNLIQEEGLYLVELFSEGNYLGNTKLIIK